MKYGFQFVILFLTVVAFSTSPALAGFCVTVEGKGIDTVPTPEDFRGSGILTINGRDRTVDVDGINMGFTEVEEDGTQLAVTATDWQIRGTAVKFTTIEDARLIPTDTPGIFDYVGRSVVKTGNKRFNCGEMVILGVVDFEGGTASFPQLRGKLCQCD